MIRKLLASVVISLTVFTSFGQSPQFSQFYAAPMYLNPAFVGNTDQSRLIGSIARGAWVEDWLSVTRSGISLGLLRSRPDPIGERPVRRLPPVAYMLRTKRGRKG